MRPAYRVRLAANLVNGSTVAGVLVGLAGRARFAPAGDGLLVGAGYRLSVPAAPAFCIGNVILARAEHATLGSMPALLAHEARHATQYAWCGGLTMLPWYFLAAGCSWVLTGDFGARNIFEQRAGLADGGYRERPLRPWLAGRGRAGEAAGPVQALRRRLSAPGPTTEVRRVAEVSPPHRAAPPGASRPGFHPGPDH